MREFQSLEIGFKAEIEELKVKLELSRPSNSENNSEPEKITDDSSKDKYEEIVNDLNKNIDFLSNCLRDKKDESDAKDEQIRQLKDLLERKEENSLKSSSSSLAEELNLATFKGEKQDFEEKIKKLET